MEGLAKLNVDLVNVHAAGGVKMMSEAIKGLRKHNQDTKIIAVNTAYVNNRRHVTTRTKYTNID